MLTHFPVSFASKFLRKFDGLCKFLSGIRNALPLTSYLEFSIFFLKYPMKTKDQKINGREKFTNHLFAYLFFCHFTIDI